MPYYRIPEMDPLSPAEGVEIRVIHGERMTLAFFRVSAGARVPEHAHPHEQIGTVIRGVMDLAVGDETFTVRTGDAYHVPGGVPHSGYCGEETELVEAFCPVREDMR
ncbi:MAG: cupin domain-containing protein [Deltaproteobacteria bacterium]|nr:cupin domain-containing protein [Deltaproteobacteria bacterium]